MVRLCAHCRRDLGLTWLLLGVAAALSVCARVEAGDQFWSNSRGDGSGAFSDEDNWIPDLPFSSDVPDDSDFAHFGMTTSSAVLPATYTVSFNVDPTNLRLIVEDDRVTFDLNGHTYQATSPIAVLLGTEAGRTGRLTVTDGTLSHPLQADIQIGTVAGGSGILNVTTGGLILGSPEIIVGVNGGGTLNVTSGGDVIAGNTLLGQNNGSSGAATITGASSSLLTAQLHVGSGFLGGAGSLTIANGGRVDSSYADIRSASATPAMATVSGANSKWTSSSQMNVGFGSVGSLSITDGGQVQDADASIGNIGVGTATVDGPSSKWSHSGDFRIGIAGSTPDDGIGTLNIMGGALVENTTAGANVEVGSFQGMGVVNVDGADSRWIVAGQVNVGLSSRFSSINVANGGRVQANSVNVGSGGTGTMNITAGGLVQNATGNVGLDSGDGAVHVDGLNSRWLNSDDLGVGSGSTSTGLLDVANGGRIQANLLKIGGSGNGTLNISSGGRVDSQESTLGLFPGSTGSVTVAGAGSTWTIDGNLRVGNNGTVNGGVGTLRIQPGGTVAVGGVVGGVGIGGTTLHQGDLVVLEGGTLSTYSINFLEGHGTFQWTSGTLRLVQYDGNLLVPDGGVFAPGSTIGDPQFFVMVFGGYTQRAGATLEIDYLSTFVNVANTAALDGTLALNFNGAVPNPSTNYTIFDALSIAGSFANVANGQRLTTVDGLGSFIVNYGAGSPFDPSQIVLSSFLASVGLPGDYNQNGIVDAADYVVWRKNLGSSTSLPNDDTPGVGPDDYTRWRTHFGQTAGSGSGTNANAAVPEPATFVLLILVTAASCCLRRRRAA